MTLQVKNEKTFIIKSRFLDKRIFQMICLVLICLSSRADLPIHCLKSQTVGTWKIKIIDKNYFQNEFEGSKLLFYVF